MKKLLIYSLVLILLCSCGSGTFQVPKQEYQTKVQVLGVLPLLIDRQANLDYPQKEAIYDLLTRSNLGKHERLVELLKGEKGYFDVRAISADAELLENSLLASELPPNVDDALLVVVFTGAKVQEIRRSRNLLESLTTGYSDVLATATVIDRNGQTLWQMAGADSFQALILQYADFDEAYFNRTEQVQVKNINFAGIEPLLAEEPDKSGQDRLPKLYQQLFNQIVTGISPGLLDGI